MAAPAPCVLAGTARIKFCPIEGFCIGFRPIDSGRVGFWQMEGGRVGFEVGFRPMECGRVGFEVGFRKVEGDCVGIEVGFWPMEGNRVGFEVGRVVFRPNEGRPRRLLLLTQSRPLPSSAPHKTPALYDFLLLRAAARNAEMI